MREDCPDTEFFLVPIQENTDQKNSVFGHFPRSAFFSVFLIITLLNHSDYMVGHQYLFISKFQYTCLRTRDLAFQDCIQNPVKHKRWKTSTQQNESHIMH